MNLKRAWMHSDLKSWLSAGKGPIFSYTVKTMVLKSTLVVFVSDHSPNINTPKNQINTVSVLSNTVVFVVYKMWHGTCYCLECFAGPP